MRCVKSPLRRSLPRRDLPDGGVSRRRPARIQAGRLLPLLTRRSSYPPPSPPTPRAVVPCTHRKLSGALLRWIWRGNLEITRVSFVVDFDRRSKRTTSFVNLLIIFLLSCKWVVRYEMREMWLLRDSSMFVYIHTNLLLLCSILISVFVFYLVSTSNFWPHRPVEPEGLVNLTGVGRKVRKSPVPPTGHNRELRVNP